MNLKPTLFALFLMLAAAWGQTPPPPGAPAAPRILAGNTNRDELIRQLRHRLGAETNGPAGRNLRPPPGPGGPAEEPLPSPPPGMAPGVSAGNPSLEKANVLAPTHPRTNAAAEETPLPTGMIDFRQATLDQVLDIYSMMVNRTVLRPASLAAPAITLRTQGQLTMKEGVQALSAVLGLNGVALIDVGDKFVKAVPQPQAPQEGQEPSRVPAGALPNMGQYVTHVVQLKYLKPSEAMPALTPFAKLPNSIIPIEASQMLVLRDNTENVKRMLEMIESIDVVVPAEYTNEVIMIKYALAADIASALNSLSSGGGGATVGSSGRAAGGTTGSRSTSRDEPHGDGEHSGFDARDEQPFWRAGDDDAGNDRGSGRDGRQFHLAAAEHYQQGGVNHR